MSSMLGLEHCGCLLFGSVEFIDHSSKTYTGPGRKAIEKPSYMGISCTQHNMPIVNISTATAIQTFKMECRTPVTCKKWLTQLTRGDTVNQHNSDSNFNLANTILM